MIKPDIVTPAGIRQAYISSTSEGPITFTMVYECDQRLSPHGDRQKPSETMALGDGKVKDPQCVCDGWTAQNAAHLQQCPWVGDGRCRLAELILYERMRSGVRGWWSLLRRIGGAD